LLKRSSAAARLDQREACADQQAAHGGIPHS
jgi:hypothetical protein